MVVTDDGIIKSPFSPLQPLNALTPIVVTDGEIVKPENPVQPPNVPVSIVVTDPGITRVPCSFKQSWKA